jgi:hypothetical protein
VDNRRLDHDHFALGVVVPTGSVMAITVAMTVAILAQIGLVLLLDLGPPMRAVLPVLLLVMGEGGGSQEEGQHRDQEGSHRVSLDVAGALGSRGVLAKEESRFMPSV